MFYLEPDILDGVTLAKLRGVGVYCVVVI